MKVETAENATEWDPAGKAEENDLLEKEGEEAARPLKAKGDGRGHRLSCAWGAWAVIGFTLRWFEETSQPLADGTADFIRLQQPLTDATSAYLSE